MTSLNQLSEVDIYNKNIDEIQHQVALRDIINVNGSLTIHRDFEEENRNFIKKLSRIDYLNQLNNTFNKKKTIKRDVLAEEITDLLETENTVLIHGKPGVGKSFLLNEVQKKYESIYVSFKDKSEKKVLLYLLSKTLSPETVNEIKLLTLEEILFEFEISLQNTDRLFIFDDCERMLPLLKNIINIENFSNKFLFSSRNSNITESIVKYEIQGFSKSEINEFLTLNDVELDLKNYEELVNASQGNPLYLFYYSKSQINPIPIGLKAYQESLWSGLEIFQKEILIFISLPLFSIDFPQIKSCIEKNYNKEFSPQEFNAELDKIAYLINVQENGYSLFHLSLSEYLEEKLEKQGSIKEYKKILGNTMLEAKEYLEAINLLIDIDDKKIKDYILRPLPLINDLGLFHFGIKVLNKAIELFNSEDEIFERGFSYHHLSTFYRENYQIEESSMCNKNSIKCFEKIGNKDFVNIAKLYEALDLIEVQKVDEAKQIVEEIKKYSSTDKEYQGCIYVNLSKFYIELFLYEEAIKYAELSYNIFKELDQVRGIKTSLNNLAISHSFLDSDLDIKLSIKYAELLLDLAENTSDIRLIASVSNLLTRSFRMTKNYEEAIKHAKRSINIAIDIKSDSLFIKNLINLGNVYRDKKDYPKALSSYQTSRKNAEEKAILVEEVRALELITEIFIKMEDLENANFYALESLEKSKKSGIGYRISEAHSNLAYVLFMQNKEGWKDHFNCSLDVSKEYGTTKSAIRNILYFIEIFEKKLTIEEIKSYYDYIFENSVPALDFDRIIYSIINQKKFNISEKIDNTIKILTQYINLNSKSDIHSSIIAFTILCRENCTDDVKKEFFNILNCLVEKIEKPQIISIFIIMILQSQVLVENDEITFLIDEILLKYEKIYFRKIRNEDRIFTIFLSPDIKFQILSLEKSECDFKISLLLAIILRFYWDYIEKNIKKLQANNYSLVIMNTSSLTRTHDNDILENITEKKPHVFFLDQDKNNNYVVLHENYEQYLDLNNNRESGAFQVLLLEMLISIFANFDINYDFEKYGKRTINIIDNLLFSQTSFKEIAHSNLKFEDVKKRLEGYKKI